MVLVCIDKYKTEGNNHFYKVDAFSERQYDFYIVIDGDNKILLLFHEPNSTNEPFFTADLSFLSDDPQDTKWPHEISSRVYFPVFLKAYRALQKNQFPEQL